MEEIQDNETGQKSYMETKMKKQNLKYIISKAKNN